MQIALTAKQMRAVDSYMMNKRHIPGIILMENAAWGVCGVVMEQMEPCVAHVFCGTGNNGGDGLAVGRILMAHGYDVYVTVLGGPGAMTADTAKNFEMFADMGERAKCIAGFDQFEAWDIPEAELVVDAIFGTGLTREVEGIYADCIDHINASPGATVVSVDIPSGINADTGAAMGAAVVADITVTFQYPKLGHFLFPGREYAGYTEVVMIGVDDGCGVAEDGVAVYCSGDVELELEPRRVNSSKGDYGRLLFVAGSAGMAGAAVLGARAAIRAGAGLVTVASTENVVQVMQNSVPEATCRILSDEEGVLTRNSVFEIARLVKGKTALAIGPGLGSGGDIRDVVENIVREYDVPKVMDADAINAMAANAELLRDKKGEIILTPHPREFARLIDVSLAAVLKKPLELAQAFAREFGVVLVLKGATTIIANAGGETCMVAAGSPGMAKGGSGDVLTGVIGGLLAQGLGAFESACKGVYIAAMAGEYAAEDMGEYSMTPMDECDRIPKAIREMICGCGHTLNRDDLMPEPEPGSVVRETVREDKPRPDEKPAGEPGRVKVITQEIPVIKPEKTAEQAIAEIEAKEKTREFKKDENNGGPGPDDPRSDGPTRRRIG
jgi:NAD(P)H-hydrate epimerase